MSDCRLALVHAVRTAARPLTQVAREFGVSRKTAYKWLAVFDAHPHAPDLHDRSRRPRHSPRSTPPQVEQRVLGVRDRFGWGPRKIHAYLLAHDLKDQPQALPSIRTLGTILARHGRIDPPPRPDAPPPQRFEREQPNDLWQIDHKGPIEVDRRKVCPFSVLDDHSRWCLSFEPMLDRTTTAAWDVLWRVFGDVGLPRQILSDRAFGGLGTARPVGLSTFEARLVRLGIDPRHGQPRHPQTQGKVEALHRSSVRELIRRHARRDTLEHFRADCQQWRMIYNTLRPHEALDDRPPLSRWRPSNRPRPQTLPDVAYEAGAITRIACREGLIRCRGCRILVGRGVSGQPLRLEERESELWVYYGFKCIRQLRLDELTRDHVL